MDTCFHLCPTSAFAIASRWRDRDVGRSDRMLASLLEAALNSDVISPSSAWATAALPFAYSLVDFAGQCIAKEKKPAKQQLILNDLVTNFRQQGITGKEWKVIGRLAEKYNLHHDALNQLELLIGKENEEKASRPNHDSYEGDNTHGTCEELFGNIEILTNAGIQKALVIWKKLEGYRDSMVFWNYVSNQITNAHAVQYLLMIANAEYLSFFDIRDAIRSIPIELKEKVGIKKVWPKVVSIIAERFPDYFLRSGYYRDEILGFLGNDEQSLYAVRTGIFKSLSESNGLETASTFYGFAGTCVQELTEDGAKTLFDFALSRFEIHIDKKDYADGPWRAELHPPMEMTISLTGYIWASLGSPESNERWRAAHVVRRLYRLGCQEEIDALIGWMCDGQVEPFTCEKYPFYNMHARQYLLVALSRCVSESPDILIKHSETFCNIALNDESHILIQSYATTIALVISKANPSIYGSDIINQLQQIGKSPFPIETVDNYREKRDTLWHQQGNLDLSLDFSFGYDFDRYWFEPLGDVFNVPGKQVEELATEVVLKNWQLSFSERYFRDPRQEIWNKRRDRSTGHSHSSYPKTDNYSFYLSYHAMMSVAAKLLKVMPVIHSHDWKDDEWKDWLGRHLLTRDNGLWLADRRDFIPVIRRQWLYEKTDDDWRWQIRPNDFLDVLLFEQQNQTWLNVAASWNDYHSGHDEDIYIASRLVPCWASASLQRAIINHPCDMSGGISLGHFDSQDYEEEPEYPFKSKKWYTQGESYSRVDEFDPFAGALEYPPILPSPEIVSELNLSTDNENRNWYCEVTDGVVLSSKLWSEDKPLNEENDYCSKGNQLQASLKFLKVFLSNLIWI